MFFLVIGMVIWSMNYDVARLLTQFLSHLFLNSYLYLCMYVCVSISAIMYTCMSHDSLLITLRHNNSRSNKFTNVPCAHQRRFTHIPEFSGHYTINAH